MITTDKVYENKRGETIYREDDELGGHDPYSTSKACAEFIIRSYVRSFFNPNEFGKKHSTLICSARAGNVIGGGDWSKDRLMPDIIRAFLESNETLIIRNPQAVRPWQHVLEPLTGYLILAKELYQKNQTAIGGWNFASNPDSFVKVETIVQKAQKIFNKGDYKIINDNNKHEATILKLDATKAKEKLNWHPILNIDENLNWTFEWYKRFYSGENMELFTQNQISYFFLRLEHDRA